MTRAELHNVTGFHPPSLMAVATHLRDSMARNKVAQEPTALIRNEGYLNGYLDALQDIERAAYQQAPTTAPKQHQPYSAPQQPSATNQNQA